MFSSARVLYEWLTRFDLIIVNRFHVATYFVFFLRSLKDVLFFQVDECAFYFILFVFA